MVFCLPRNQSLRPRAEAHAAVRASRERAKERFLGVVGTLASRGSTSSSVSRGVIEERIIELERFAEDVDFSLLYGGSQGSQAWDVVYTTARDVRGLMQDRPLPFCEATMVGQEFFSGGQVTNFIRLTAVDDRYFPLTNLLSGTSLNVKVRAQWSATGAKSIGLRFLSATVGEIEIEDGSPLASLLTSAILPRGQWNLDLINGLRDIKLIEWNLIGEADRSKALPSRPSLSIGFLDDDLLIGRAVETGGLLPNSQKFRSPL